ncbi:hypothetical protein JX265_014120, partial [Neoarthrinium moseri]
MTGVGTIEAFLHIGLETNEGATVPLVSGLLVGMILIVSNVALCGTVLPNLHRIEGVLWKAQRLLAMLALLALVWHVSVLTLAWESYLAPAGALVAWFLCFTCRMIRALTAGAAKL